MEILTDTIHVIRSLRPLEYIGFFAICTAGFVILEGLYDSQVVWITNPAFNAVATSARLKNLNFTVNNNNDCWEPCGYRSGFCEHICGADGACCSESRENSNDCNDNMVHAIRNSKYGGDGHHVCVTAGSHVDFLGGYPCIYLSRAGSFDFSAEFLQILNPQGFRNAKDRVGPTKCLKYFF